MELLTISDKSNSNNILTLPSAGIKTEIQLSYDMKIWYLLCYVTNNKPPIAESRRRTLDIIEESLQQPLSMDPVLVKLGQVAKIFVRNPW